MKNIKLSNHSIKIKELINDYVSIGTFGLVELELIELEKFIDILQTSEANLVDKIIELEKQNEELIKYVIMQIETHLLINNTEWIDRNFLKTEIELLEQITGKPIDEIIKEYNK